MADFADMEGGDERGDERGGEREDGTDGAPEVVQGSAPKGDQGPGPLPLELGLRLPAEWETHEATWLAWPHNADDWPGRLERIFPVFETLIAELSESERVRLVVADGAMGRAVQRQLARRGVEGGQLELFEAPTDRSWIRDWAPLCVVGSGRLGAVKWRFDGWARYDDCARDDAAGRSITAALGAPSWEPSVHLGGAPARIVLEGGGIDVDGEGSALLSEQCMLDGPYARNPGLGREALEEALRSYLGVERVLWVGAGIAGDDTSGHVDDFIRFALPGRVLLCRDRDPSSPNHAPLEDAWRRMRGVLDARGRALELIELPMPAPVLWEGEILPASYANFYIANDRVLVPVFDDPQDAHALGVIGEVFSPRRAVAVPARDLVLGLGTVHCSTMQQPALPPRGGARPGGV